MTPSEILQHFQAQSERWQQLCLAALSRAHMDRMGGELQVIAVGDIPSKPDLSIVLATGAAAADIVRMHDDVQAQKAAPPAESIPAKAAESPALAVQSNSYPAAWNGRVPLRVRMAKTVLADAFDVRRFGLMAEAGSEYFCWVNSHGAVSAIIGDSTLGLKPYEFEVIAWHPEKVVTP